MKIEYRFSSSVLSESEKNNISIDVAKEIYELASNKLPTIDFGDITLSKGDLTRFVHYSTMIGL